MWPVARSLSLLLRSTAAVAIVAVIVWKIGPQPFAAAVVAVDLHLLVIALALSLVFLCGRSIKWMLVVRTEVPDLSLKESATSLVGGMALGMITPGRAGEISRLIFLQRGDRVSLGGLLAVDRLFDLLTVCVFGLLAAALLTRRPYNAVAMVVAGMCVAGVYGLRPSSRWVMRRIGRLPGRRTAERLVAGLDHLDRRRINSIWITSVLATAVSYVQFYILLGSFTEVPFLGATLTFSLVILSNLLPITIGGIGVREAVAAVVLHGFGVPEAAAVSAAFLSFLCNSALPGIVGAGLLARHGSRMRRMTASAAPDPWTSP